MIQKRQLINLLVDMPVSAIPFRITQTALNLIQPVFRELIHIGCYFPFSEITGSLFFIRHLPNFS